MFDLAAESKYCRKCKQLRHIDHFSPDRHFRDGHRVVCKSCVDPRTKTPKGRRFASRSVL